MNKTQARTIVFIDGSNFYRRMKGIDVLPSGLDYAKMSQKLSGNDRELIETRFYIGKIKQTRGSENLYKGQRKFLDKLRQQDNVTVHLGRIEQSNGVQREKAVDVMIAVDMVSMAYEDKYDVAYLLSADGDFTPAVKKVRESGKKVFVASPVFGYQLKKAADAFILLDKEFFNGCWT